MSESTSVAENLNDIIVDALSPAHLEVINESNNHNVPPGSESHFKLVVVSDAFAGKALLQRHRQINTLLADWLAGPIHALSLHTHTVSEWQGKGEVVPESPPCRGGNAPQ